MPDWTLLPGDCRQLMRLAMAPESIDSIVTDPPYDLTSIVKRFGAGNAAPCQYGTDGAYQRASRGFMGQQWDGTAVAFEPDTWREAWRVLKPGGHLLAFGGTRTYHRMAVAIEDAGFEIRDCIFWVYGSGFPKSHDVSKGIDKAAGAERPVIGQSMNGSGAQPSKLANHGPGDTGIGFMDGSGKTFAVTAPATPEAAEWEGWGTALKPAVEPIVMARKPLARGSSVAANVLQHRTGAINIDGCRVDGPPRPVMVRTETIVSASSMENVSTGATSNGEIANLGRFPANLIHDGSDEVLACFPETKSGRLTAENQRNGGFSGTVNCYGTAETGGTNHYEPDSGSAARFFYCAKASKADREEGCDSLPLVAAGMVSETSGQHITRREEGYEPPKRANHHPTVKPTALMRYLCRLVTPPGGTILDPFAGSGSTGKAALLEGFDFIGCEMTPEYVPIAEARLAHALAQRESGE